MVKLSAAKHLVCYRLKEGYGNKLTLEVVDKNDKRDLNRQIPYVTYGWILGENGFPDNWREALDRDAIMDELRNSFSTSGDVYVRLMIRLNQTRKVTAYPSTR